jgi:hypothetical protein
MPAHQHRLHPIGSIADEYDGRSRPGLGDGVRFLIDGFGEPRWQSVLGNDVGASVPRMTGAIG